MEVSGKIKENCDETSGETNFEFCEPCRSDCITKQADGFCKECEEFTCNACFTQHLRAKSCRNHVMVDGDQSLLVRQEIAVGCSHHDGETIKFYCRKHGVVGCGDCMVFEHKSCDSEYINTVSKDFHLSQDFQTLTNKIEQLETMNKTSEENIQENKRNNQLMLEKALGDITEYRNDINKHLDKVEAYVTTKAKTIMSENDTVLVELKNKCELLSTKIENTKEKLNVECFRDNELFINTVENKTTVMEIEKEVAEIQSKGLRKFEFAPDEELRNLITSRQQLGQLATTPLALSTQLTQKTQSRNWIFSGQKDTAMTSSGTVADGARVHDYEKIKEIETNITAMDDDLSAKEKEDERERNEKQIEKILKDQEESREKVLQEQEEALKKYYEKLKEDREQKSERDTEKMEALFRAKLEKEIAEEEVAKLQKKERKMKWFGEKLWNALNDN